MGAAATRKKNGTYPARTVKPSKPALPHYTRENVVALLNSNDPRIQKNDYGTAKHIVLSDDTGYFMYSDKDGGTATFYAETWEPEYTETPIFTASVVITDEMRESKCGNPACTTEHDWTQLTYKCGCTTHHEGERFAISPRIEVCSPDECDGQHGHLYGFCALCFDIDKIDGKNPADATANAIHLLLR
jgi:hypothetical protein